MKLAISGKGGTGKTTLAGILSHLFRRDGYEVLAVDADPDANADEDAIRRRAGMVPRRGE